MLESTKGVYANHYTTEAGEYIGAMYGQYWYILALVLPALVYNGTKFGHVLCETYKKGEQ